ncbi:MAG: amidohydrolase family protein [Proteobacteria bacterium]|nr:amidohydrolase family protein [Pseudomonadota bacterium]
MNLAAQRVRASRAVLRSIEVGKLADLVVFDGNILAVRIEDLDDLKPVLTMVGGKIAFEASGL